MSRFSHWVGKLQDSRLPPPLLEPDSDGLRTSDSSLQPKRVRHRNNGNVVTVISTNVTKAFVSMLQHSHLAPARFFLGAFSIQITSIKI